MTWSAVADPRTVAIVQARMGSSRLPGKVLADLGGRPVLAHLLETARSCELVDEVVLAVPDEDARLIEFGRNSGVRTVTGDEHDVLARFHHAADLTGADRIVRLTGDCPLLDGAELSAAIGRFDDGAVDYSSVEDYPRGMADIEIVTRSALSAAHSEATDPWHREHVCTFFPDHPDRFRVRIDRPPASLSRPTYRLCVDQPEDLVVVREVHRRLGGAPASVGSVVAMLDADPALAAINAQVVQVTRSTAS